MPRLFFYLFFLFFTISGISQDSQVFIKSIQKNDWLVMACHNKTSHKVLVKFGLVDVKGLRGNFKPIKKWVAAKDSAVFKKLRITSEKVSYKYDFHKNFPKSVLAKKEISLKDHPNLQKGIVVFNSANSSRCHYVLNYFLENNIDFKLLNLKKPKNNKLMWKMLREVGYRGKNVHTPVILVNGKISYNHRNLRQFVKDLDRKT